MPQALNVWDRMSDKEKSETGDALLTKYQNAKKGFMNGTSSLSPAEWSKVETKWNAIQNDIERHRHNGSGAGGGGSSSDDEVSPEMRAEIQHALSER